MEPGAEAAFVIPEYAELQPLDASATIFTATDLAVPDDDAPLLFSTLNAVRQVAAHHDVTCTVTGVAGLELFVVAQIANLRSAISRCAVIAASELATVYGANICGRPSVDLFVSSLLVKASGDKRFIRDPAQQALRNLVAVRCPTALLYQALLRHATSKNRVTVSLSAELAQGVLHRLSVEQLHSLDLPSVACHLASYMTGKSAEARSAAFAMSCLLCAANGYPAWREVVLAVCTEQVSRELLRDLEPAVATVDIEEGVVGVDKENDPPCDSARLQPGSICMLPLHTPAKGTPAQTCGSAHSQSRLSGRRSLGASHVSLRHYLKEREDIQGAGETLSQSKKRMSLSGARKGAVTPVLVLQRTLSSPAVSRSTLQPLQYSGNAMSPAAAYAAMGKVAAVAAVDSTPRSGKQAIELPIGEEAAKVLEDWCVA